MAEISPERVVDMNKYLKPEWCEVVDGRTPTSIFSKAGYRDSIYNAHPRLEERRDSCRTELR